MSKVKYIKSAILPKDFPKTKLKEIAFVGRSNAGKSSLINAIVDQKIANVSSTPGKTRLLSFFNYQETYVLVDMPGYGFAVRGRDEVNLWKEMIEGYFSYSEKLSGVILVMDIRRDWAEEEQLMKDFANHFQFPLILVLTKVDKLSFSQKSKRLEEIKKKAQLESIFMCSTLKKEGTQELQDFIIKNLVFSKGNKE